jgi:hypothetical protein
MPLLTRKHTLSPCQCLTSIRTSSGVGIHFGDADSQNLGTGERRRNARTQAFCLRRLGGEHRGDVTAAWRLYPSPRGTV